MNTEDLMVDKVQFTATNGKEYYFIKFIKDKVQVWENASINYGDCFLRERVLDIYEVGVEGAKALKMWDSLSPELQKELENSKIITKKSESQEKHDRQDKQDERKEKIKLEREEVRKSYAHYPKEVECSCGAKTKLNPSQLFKHIEKKGITLEAYQEKYLCRNCNPIKRGRVSTGKSIPIILKCSCGSEVTYPKSVVIKQAEKKGKVFEDYVKGWSCQKCVPSKGKHKKS
jgi:hypothetical protein